MRATSFVPVALALASYAAASCGPPPALLRGRLGGSVGCVQGSGGQCTGRAWNFNGEDGSTISASTGHLKAQCYVYPRSDSYGPVHIRFQLGEETTAMVHGLAFCGYLPTTTVNSSMGTAVTRGSYTIYLGGARTSGALSDGHCEVRFTALGTDSFTGRIKCSQVPTDISGQFLSLGGAVPATTGTEWAEFDFSTCKTSAPSLCAE